MPGYMSNLVLKASKRLNKSADKTRASGGIPAIVYGRSLDPVSISINSKDFIKLFEQAGEATIFSLDIEGEQHDVLVHDYQSHPVNSTFSHVDFYAIEKGQLITVSVPLEFIGDSPVSDIGQVAKVLYELEVECEPRNLPSQIDVDLSLLREIGDTITVSDLKIGEGVMPTLSPEEIVVTTSEAQAAEVIVDEAVDFSTIEVQKKGSAVESEDK